jgi:hypothetical protein
MEAYRYLASTPTYGATFDVVDADAQRGDVEIWALCSSTVGLSSSFGVVLARANGALGAETFYALRWLSSLLQIGRQSSGTFTTLTSISASRASSTRYQFRFRINGTTLSAKLWVDGASEPTTWQVSTSNSTITGAGRAGIFCRAIYPAMDYFAIGIGTNGDAAPTAPVSVPDSLIASPGSVIATGSAAILTETVAAQPGAAALTSRAATLTESLAARPGAAALTGQAATLTEALAAQPGAAALTSRAATLTESLAAQPGAAALTGHAAALTESLAARPGAAALTGQAATLTESLDAQPGAAALTGHAATLTESLAAQPGAAALTGHAAILTDAIAAIPGAARFIGGIAVFGGAIVKIARWAATLLAPRIRAKIDAPTAAPRIESVRVAAQIYPDET